MTPLEKQKNFARELKALLDKYKAEISIEDFGRAYMRDEKMVVSFQYDDSLYQENDTGMIPDLVLGTFF